ncbi:MAG TPA: S8 family serine peptidase [Burkholderiaceae bacterium]|nr:S8 family serine peptidase [Burkholderiaceae bacterium]
MPSSPRQRGRALALLAALAAAAGLLLGPRAQARSAGGDAGGVSGLIVQLRAAPTHTAAARDRGGLHARETERWQRLAGALRGDAALARELPLVERHWRRDPVGASAQLLRFERALSAAEAGRIAARLAADPAVAWVQPNTRERRMGGAANPPNDPYFAGRNFQWWLQPLAGSDANVLVDRLRGVPDFQTAWQTEAGVAATVVAVLDSGLTAHPDLAAARILPGYDFVADAAYANDGDGRDANPADPGDWVDAADRTRDPGRFGSCEIESSSWHGTVIAGMVGAQTDNGLGAAAINRAARLLPVRVAGKCGAEVADIVEGMRWAAGLPACKRGDGAGGCAEFAPANPHPARIVNISFGGSAACGSAYQTAIDELRAAPGGGAVVVAAAGNEHRGLSRPASCNGAIGVVALNRDGFKTNYSNFGASAVIATVGGDDVDSGARWNSLADSGLLSIGNPGTTTAADCSAPGANCYFYHWGTSFSTPVVAGAVSLMLAANPALTAAEIVTGLRASARPHATSTLAGFNACSDANPGRCLCTTATCGAGILDVPQALAYAAAIAAQQPYVAPARQPARIDAADVAAAVALGADRPPNVGTPPASTGGGGGGPMGGVWLGLLALATFSLHRARRRPSA